MIRRVPPHKYQAVALIVFKDWDSPNLAKEISEILKNEDYFKTFNKTSNTEQTIVLNFDTLEVDHSSDKSIREAKIANDKLRKKVLMSLRDNIKSQFHYNVHTDLRKDYVKLTIKYKRNPKPKFFYKK